MLQQLVESATIMRKSGHSLRSFLAASDIVSPLHPPDGCCPLCNIQQSKLACNALDSSSSTVSPPSPASDGPPLRCAILAEPGHRPLPLEPDPKDPSIGNDFPSFKLILTRAGHLRASDAGCYALCTQRLRSVTYVPPCAGPRPPAMPVATLQHLLPSPGQDSSQSPLYKLGTQNKQRYAVAGSCGAKQMDVGTHPLSPPAVDEPASIVLEFPFIALHVWMDAQCLHGEGSHVAEANKNKNSDADNDEDDEEEDVEEMEEDDDDENLKRSPLNQQQSPIETIAPARMPEAIPDDNSTVAKRAANLRRQTMQMQELSRSLEALVGSPSPDSLSCGAEPAHLSSFEQRLSAERNLLSELSDQHRVSIAMCRFAWRLAVWDLPDVYPYVADDSEQRDEDSIADAFVAEEAALEHLMRMPLVPASGERSAVYLSANGTGAMWSIVRQCAEVDSLLESSPIEAIVRYEPGFIETRYCAEGRKCTEEDLLAYEEIHACLDVQNRG